MLNGEEIYFKNWLTYPNKKSKTVSVYVFLKSEEISFALLRKLCTVEASTKCYWTKANAWWNDGCKSLLSIECTEAAIQKCSSKSVLLQISQYSQENTYVGFFSTEVAGL